MTVNTELHNGFNVLKHISVSQNPMKPISGDNAFADSSTEVSCQGSMYEGGLALFPTWLKVPVLCRTVCHGVCEFGQPVLQCILTQRQTLIVQDTL